MLLKILISFVLKVFAGSCQGCPKEMGLFHLQIPFWFISHICPLCPPALHKLNLCDLVKVSLFLISPWQRKVRHCRDT